MTLAQGGDLGRLFLSVGAMKAGTTWLFRALKQHPQLGFGHEKEPAYFYDRYAAPGHLSLEARVAKARDVYLTRQAKIARPEALPARMAWIARYIAPDPLDDAWYLSLFPKNRNHRWLCDFSNLNALVPSDGWRDLATRCAALKVLYTLRDPMERYWSQTRFQLIQTGALDGTTVPDAGLMEQAFQSVVASGHGDYAGVLTRMQSALPEGSVLVQIHEERHADPVSALRDLETFLGLEPAQYPEPILSTSVNATGDAMDIPDTFVQMARPQVAQDLAALDAAGVALPQVWAKP